MSTDKADSGSATNPVNNDTRATNSHLLLETFKHEIKMRFWAIERLNDKAKSVQSTGGLVLSFTIAILVGITSLFGRSASGDLVPIGQLFGQFTGVVLVFGIMGFFGILVSTGLATYALRIAKDLHFLAGSNFMVDRGGLSDVDNNVLNNFIGLTTPQLYQYLHSILTS